MIESIEDLRSAGVLPIGPVSAWPKERNVAGKGMQGNFQKAGYKKPTKTHDQKVNAGLLKMAKGLATVSAQAVANGKVSSEIREERYDTCKACPHFIEDSKRCSECGCFMQAKTWVAGNPDMLCPKQKWSR